MIYLAHFIGTGLLVNFVPHFVQGVCGRSFQSPFGKPPGVGLSSPVTNVFWGGLNFIVGFLLLSRVGPFDAGDNPDVAATFAGGWLTAFLLARYFARIHGGEDNASDD